MSIGRASVRHERKAPHHQEVNSVNEPGTPHSDSPQLMDPQAWRSFAASFAQTWKAKAHARQLAVERERVCGASRDVFDFAKDAAALTRQFFALLRTVRRTQRAARRNCQAVTQLDMQERL
jgi:hypothetical protein